MQGTLKIFFALSLSLLFSAMALAETTVETARTQFSFKDADLSAVIAEVGRVTGKTFIVDPVVRGKISILPQGPLTADEIYKAFNIALMVNGYSTVEMGKFTAIQPAQSVQRTQIPVYEKLPADLNAQMITYVRKLKYASAKAIYNELGPILQSRYGEMRVFENTNELISTDYAPNQYRIAQLIDEMDVPEAAPTKGHNQSPKRAEKIRSP